MWIFTNGEILRLDNFDRVYTDGSYTWIRKIGGAPVPIARGDRVEDIQNAIMDRCEWIIMD